MIKNESSMNKKAAVIIAAAAVVLLFAGIFCGAAAAADTVTITFYNDDGTVIGEPQIVSDIPQNGTAKVVLLKKMPLPDDPANNKYFIGWEDRKNPGKYYTDRQALSLTRYSPATLELKAVFGGRTTVVSSGDDYHITQNGYYQLKAGESEVTSAMHVSKGVLAVLDLNGVDVHWKPYDPKRVVENEGTLMIKDSSQEGPGMITGGRYVDGAGIRVYTGACLTIERAVIENNAVDGKGGGIYVENGGQVTMLEGAVIGPTGVYWGNNEARYGAGVYVEKGGIFTMAGGSIQKNCKYGSGEDKEGYGTGVYVAGTFNMLGGSISQNAAHDDDKYLHGAGVYVADGGTFIMTGGTISGNGDRDDSAERKGAGVYIAKGGEFVGTGGAVENNEGGKSEGTGIYCKDGGRFYVSGTFSVQNNQHEDIRFAGTGLVLMGPYTGTLNISSAPDVLGGENYKTAYIPTAADLSHIFCPNGKKIGIDTEYLSSTVYYRLKMGNVHTVSFDWLYPGKPADQTVIHGGHAAKPANPKGDAGHRFDKWYTDSAYTTPFDFTNNTITKDTDLYGRSSTVELIKYDGKIYNENTIVMDGSPFAGCEYSPDSRILKITTEVISLGKAVEIIAPGGLDPVFTIDLNGNAISCAAAYDSVIKVTAGSALNITDSNPTSAQFFEKLPSGALEWLGPDAVSSDVLLKGGIITGGTKSGVYVDSGAQVTMFAGSIAGNKGDDLRGGGVYVGEKGSFILKGGAAVTGNESTSGGGVYVDSVLESGTLIPGSLTVEGGEISNNVATSNDGGGGIFSHGGEVCIDGGAVSGNSAKNGGGITITRGNTLILKGGVISGNSAEYNGGGVYMWSTTDKFTMTGGKISANTALTGGGVYNMGSFVMEGGEISSNTANSASSNDDGGAGVYVAAYSTFTLKNGLISTNVSNSFGGGVQCNGSFVMWGGKISDNRAALGGGGVYVEESDADNKGFTFNAGRILRNVVSSATDEVGSGGGICVYNGGKAVMRETTYNASKVAGNKANYGGGVFVAGQNSAFTLESGWIGDPGLPNHAGYGGGFYVQEGGRFTMTGGYVHGNWAGQKGGAGVVYAGGTVSISGGAVLETDKAGLLSSGISVASDGQKSARLEISDKARVFQVCLADETPIYITGKFADGEMYGVSNIVFNGGSVTGAVAAECADEAIAQSSLSHLKLNAAKHSDSTLIVEGKKITLQRIVCTVKFVNEGSIWKTERVYCNTLVTKPDDPHSTIGLTFLGWFTSAGSAWVFTTPVTSDMTLYAHYGEQPTVKIAFDPNGGIFVKGHQSAAKTVSCIVGSKFEPYFNDLEVSFTGRKLTGWFTEPDGGTQVPYDEIITTSSPTKLYAHWTPITYKIEYNPGEGSGGKYYQDCTYGTEAALLENRFTSKPGYTFAGWDVPGVMELKQPGDRVINLTTKDGDTVPVTAVWKANMHTVTFYSDGAEPFSMPAETGSLIPKPDDPEKPDYTFAGWYKEPEFTTPWNFGIDRMPDNDLSLYAKWTENPKYRVTYDLNEGSGTAPVDSVLHPAGSQVTVMDKTSDMKRVGYTFNGWSGKPDGTGISYMPGHTFTITDNTTLYAKWVKDSEYNITVSTDEHGTASASPSHAVAGTIVRLSYTPDAGYEFDRWESADVTIADNTFVMPAKNVTVKAYFKELPKVMYTVTYDVNGGEGTAPAGGKYEAGTDVLVKDKTSDMKKVGYTFNGWNSKPEGGGTAYQPGTTFEITGDVTLYAEWIKESVYNISVLTDGHGTASPDHGSAVAGTTIRLSYTPNAGYKFDHWESTDVSVSADNTFVMPAQNVTVKACFTKVMYTVTYDVNGGSGTPPVDSDLHPAGSQVTVMNKTSDMKKDGCTFFGWNSKPDGTGTTYRYGDKFTITDNTTLYAEWVEESVYDISVLTDGHGTASPDHGSAVAGTTIRLSYTADEGYEFDRWESDDVTVGPDNTFVMPAQNVTVKAYFKELPKVKYTVTYDVNGGSGTAPAGGEYEAGSQVTVMDKTSDMKKDGYYFAEWNSKPDGTGTTYQPETTFTITGNTTLYAEWVEESVYDISVSTDGHGTASSDHGSAAPGTTIRLSYTADEGYEFDRWESDVTITDNTFVMPAQNVTVKAHFKELPKVKYTVSYDGNEATSGSAPESAEYEAGTTVRVQGNAGGLARDGYTFSGWNSEPDGTGTDYQPGSTFVISGNITLYAEWTPVGMHSITIDIIGPGHATSDKPFAAAGETVHLYGSADPGYAMTDWFVYPSDLIIREESETSLYFTMPDEDVYLYGFFGPAPGPTPTPTPKPTPHQGGSQGSSEWITKTLTPTPTPTPTPTGLPTPTAVPLATPTETSKSPIGIAGILAGLGAAAVLLRRK